MNAVIGLGRYLLLIPLLGHGVKHLMDGAALAGMVPAFLPGGIFWIYLTGSAMLLAVVSALIGKWDKLALFLAGCMILIFAATIHLRGVMEGGNPRVLFDLLKDVGLTGACWMYASAYARDKSLIG
jgi:putative oxidoreductase